MTDPWLIAVDYTKQRALVFYNCCSEAFWRYPDTRLEKSAAEACLVAVSFVLSDSATGVPVWLRKCLFCEPLYST